MPKHRLKRSGRHHGKSKFLQSRLTRLFVQEAVEAEDSKGDEDDDEKTPDKSVFKSVLPAILAKQVGVAKPSADDDTDDDDADELSVEDKLTQAAARLISTHVTLIPDKGGSDGAMAEQVAATVAGSYQIKEHGIQMGKGSVLLIMDPANMTESSSHPHLRKCQVSQQLVDRAVNVGSIARSITRTGQKEIEDNAIVSGEDVWLIFDGGRAVSNTLLKPFSRCSAKQKLQVVLTYDEDSVLGNIGRVTTMSSLKCTETMYIMAAGDWSAPRRQHLHYKGSNYSDQIGPIIVDDWEADDTWKLSRKEKKSVQGRFRIDNGGAVDAGLSATSKWKTREAEPVWFHQKPFKLADELVYSYCGKALVDFAPSSGYFALVAMKRRIPYCGVTCSDGHSTELLKYLVGMVKAAMVNPDDPLYRKELCEDSGKQNPKKPIETPNPKKRDAVGSSAGKPVKKKLDGGG